MVRSLRDNRRVRPGRMPWASMQSVQVLNLYSPPQRVVFRPMSQHELPVAPTRHFILGQGTSIRLCMVIMMMTLRNMWLVHVPVLSLHLCMRGRESVELLWLRAVKACNKPPGGNVSRHPKVGRYFGPGRYLGPGHAHSRPGHLHGCG